MKMDRETLRTGIPLIDHQHEEFFDRLDVLLQMTEAGHVERDRLKEEMDGLLTYAVEHFDAEESLMQSVHYPRYEEHCAKHSAFRDDADRWNADLSDRAADLDLYSLRMVAWLQNWVCEQILVDDRQLALFLKEGSRAAARSA